MDVFGFAKNLHEQTGIYRQILELSKSQTAAIAQGNEAELLRILAEKQTRIGLIDELSAACMPLRNEWETVRSTVSTSEHDMVDSAFQELRMVLGEIVEIENLSRAQLESEKEKNTARMNQIQQGKVAHKAYGFKTPPPQSTRRNVDG